MFPKRPILWIPEYKCTGGWWGGLLANPLPGGVVHDHVYHIVYGMDDEGDRTQAYASHSPLPEIKVYSLQPEMAF